MQKFCYPLLSAMIPRFALSFFYRRRFAAFCHHVSIDGDQMLLCIGSYGRTFGASFDRFRNGDDSSGFVIDRIWAIHQICSSVFYWQRFSGF
jgi:hypothetical protein